MLMTHVTDFIVKFTFIMRGSRNIALNKDTSTHTHHTINQYQSCHVSMLGNTIKMGSCGVLDEIVSNFLFSIKKPQEH